jgi:RHS repeat-associated protein
MTTNYYSVRGEIIADSVGSVRRDFLADASKSVTDVANPVGTGEGPRRYTPYGTSLSRPLGAAVLGFQWLGGQGYRQAFTAIVNCYVRFRSYAAVLGRWSSVDPVWPVQPAYAYAHSNPIRFGDRSGMSPCIEEENCCDTMDWSRMPGCPQGSWEECPSFFGLYHGCRGSVDAADCATVKTLINEISKDCIFFCNGGRYGGDATGDAATRCCHDRSGWRGCVKCCSSANLGKKGRGLDTCKAFCLLVHEGRHKKDCPSTRQDQPPDECCGYGAQANCLFTMYAKVCNWTDAFGKPDPGYIQPDFPRCLRAGQTRCKNA